MNTKQAKGQTYLTEEEEIARYGKVLNDNYFVDRRTGMIIFRKQFGGVELKFSCKTKSPNKAYGYAPSEVKKRLKKDDKKLAVRPLISDVVTKYIATRSQEVKTGELTEKTLKIIKRSIRPVSDYFHDKFLEEVFENENMKETWRQFVEHYKNTNPKLVNRDVPCLENIVKYTNAILKWSHGRGLMKTSVRVFDPYEKQAQTARKKRKNFVFSRRDYVMMRRKANRRDRLIIELGGELAFRISDCVSLKWSQLKLNGDDPIIHIEGDDKEGYFVDIPLTKKLVRSFKFYKKHFSHPDSDYVFWQVTNPRQHIKPQQANITQAMRAAGVKKGTHHHLRHCRLTEDFGNPELPQAEVLAMRRVSYEVFLEHYYKQTVEARKRLREGSRRFR